MFASKAGCKMQTSKQVTPITDRFFSPHALSVLGLFLAYTIRGTYCASNLFSILKTGYVGYVNNSYPLYLLVTEGQN